jgi:dephospho-CoA kinase
VRHRHRRNIKRVAIMITIGVVGGIGSGKSLFAEMLRDLGARVLDADKFGHAILEAEAEVLDALRRRWGSEVFHEDGRPNRAAISGRVFGQGAGAAEERRFLEGLLHPRIRRGLEAERDASAARGVAAVVIDAALLFEAGWDTACDLVVFVDAPRDLRLERARLRGWSNEDFAAREKAQWPVEEKRRRADVVIPNAGSKEDLRDAVQAFWVRYVQAGDP